MFGACRLVVLLQQVVAEIVLEVSPDAVDVVGVVLGVVVFDQESRPLDAVVVRLSPLEAAGPREADLVDARLEDLAQVVTGQLRTQPFRVEDDDRVQQLLLLGVQVRHHDPGRLEWLGLAGGQGKDVLGGLFLDDRLSCAGLRPGT